jgi:hypothetical protein
MHQEGIVAPKRQQAEHHDIEQYHDPEEECGYQIRATR